MEGVSNQIEAGGGFSEFARVELGTAIHQRFERIVELHPERTAVLVPEEAIRYGELNRRANRVAHALLGVRDSREESVAVLADQGGGVTAFILGCLKAAKTYIPLDPDLPEASLRRLLAGAEPGLILCDRAHHGAAVRVAGDCPVLCLDPAQMSAMPESNPGLAPAPGRPAYVYYTSGSTGEPKGVADSHRNVMHNIMRYTNSLKIGPEDRLTLLQMPGFSGAVSSLFGALLNGAAVYPVNPRRESGATLAQWVRANELTMWHSVPSLFRQLCAAGGTFPSLRVIRLEGDRAPVADAELLQRHFGRRCVLVNGLGTTETGICRQYFLGWGGALEGAVFPVGYGVEDMRVAIVDDHGDAVADGHSGEIAVSSEYLALGYWKRPDLTARAFRQAENGSRVYRTGDLGRMREDGCLEHLGRMDSRVKIRGNWVDLADVEGALQTAPGVAGCAVRLDTGMDGESRLVGYVVAAPGQRLTVTAMRSHLLGKLATHQVPTAFVEMGELPLDANGKVNRKALPAAGRGRPALETAYVPAQGEAEERLEALWKQVLGLESIGAEDDFFELGGDSLAAARVVSELSIDAAALVESPTIRRLAARLDAPATWICRLRTGGRRPPLFCIPGHDGVLAGFRQLARLLPDEHPVIAFLVPPELAAGGRYSVKDLAARFVEEVVRLQPGGPLALSGFCFGGCVAYEMACQLRARGRQVSTLVMLECFNGRWLEEQPPAARWRARAELAWRRARFHVSRMAGPGPRGGLAHLQARAAKAAAVYVDSRGQRRFDRLSGARPAMPDGWVAAGYANRVAARAWRPQPYDGRVVLLGGAEPRAGQYEAPLMGWAEHLRGEVECRFLSDDLQGLLSPGPVRAVAEHLAGALAQLDAVCPGE